MIKYLIFQQIESYKNQITLMNFIYSLINVLSLIFLGFVFKRVLTDDLTSNKEFIDYISAVAAVFAPYLTFISKGFFYPLLRKINTLIELYFNKDHTEDELKIIYDTE